MPYKPNSSEDGHGPLADKVLLGVSFSAAHVCDAEGHSTRADKAINIVSSDIAPIDETIAKIRYWYRQYLYAQDQRERVNHALGSFLRLQLGWTKNGDSSVRESAKKGAVTIIKNAEAELVTKPFDLSVPHYDEYQLLALASVGARKPFDDIERRAVKEMERLAKSLPVWSWVNDVRGFGAKSLAVIVGEAGNLSNYPKKGHLWKRMGVAVIDGIAQGKLAKTASKELWIEHGYNRQRRSQMYVIGDVQVKQGRKYRDIYLARKEFERQRAEQQGLIVAPAAKIPKKKSDQYISDGHIHKRAQRYMEKMLLRDLLAAWKEADRKANIKMPQTAILRLPLNLLPTTTKKTA